MKDYFKPEYHEYRAAVEDFGRRLTAALIDYVENTSSTLEEIAAHNNIPVSTITHNAQRYVLPDYHRKRGPQPNSKAMSEKAMEIIYLTKAGTPPMDIANEVGVTRQYVYDVQAKYRKAQP